MKAGACRNCGTLSEESFRCEVCVLRERVELLEQAIQELLNVMKIHAGHG